MHEEQISLERAATLERFPNLCLVEADQFASCAFESSNDALCDSVCYVVTKYHLFMRDLAPTLIPPRAMSDLLLVCSGLKVGPASRLSNPFH